MQHYGIVIADPFLSYFNIYVTHLVSGWKIICNFSTHNESQFAKAELYSV